MPAHWVCLMSRIFVTLLGAQVYVFSELSQAASTCFKVARVLLQAGVVVDDAPMFEVFLV